MAVVFQDNSVQLAGSYGGDLSHALSAWTSTGRELTEERKERIPKLLKFLASEGHHTPFEKSTLHFLVVCDTATHIHLLKHRIGVSINAESPRYKELTEDKCYWPSDLPSGMKVGYDMVMQGIYELYHEAIKSYEQDTGSRKRAKEAARFILPYANQLKLDVSFNFRSFMHFLGLRMKSNAQDEVNRVAFRMYNLISQLDDFKYSLEAFGY